MDLFGIKEHDERHDEAERQLRRLIEQVAQLSIDLSVTRAELRGKVDAKEVDPSIAKLNEDIKAAKVKLAETKAAADQEWGRINDELAKSVEDLRSEVEADAEEE